MASLMANYIPFIGWTEHAHNGPPIPLSPIITLIVFFITSNQFAHAIITGDIELQPTSNIPVSDAVATGLVPMLAVPVTAIYNPNLPGNASLNQYLAYGESLGTSTWTISVVVFSTDSAIESRLSVSWPVGQGPSENLPKNQTRWDICSIYFADLFQHFDEQGLKGNGSCFDIIGTKCRVYLSEVVQTSGLIQAGCNGLVEIPIPESCSSTFGDKITTDLTDKHLF